MLALNAMTLGVCSSRHSRRNPFKSMKFLLISEEATAFLTNLLNMGGASSVCQYQGDGNNAGGWEVSLY